MGIESPKFETTKEKKDLTTPESRQKEIERIWADEEKLKEEPTEAGKEKPEEKIPSEVKPEKTEKELEKELEGKRLDYAEAYKNYREAFGKMKEKELKAFELTVEPLREEYIKAGDSEKLKLGDEETKERKEKFIEELEEKGIRFTLKNRAEAIYEAELKKAEYDQTREELKGKLIKEGMTPQEIFKKLFLQEHELLEKTKIETWPPKEKNIFRKGLELWMRQGTATRLLISTGLVTGVVAVAGGFSAPAIAMFAGYRYIRAAGSVLAAKLAGKGVDWTISKRDEAKHESALSQLRSGFDKKSIKETEKELEKIFEERAKRERRKLLIKGATMAAVGASAAIGASWLEQSGVFGVRVAPPAEAPPEAPAKPGVVTPEEIKPKIPTEAVPEIKPEIIEIGERGPEGAIIDSFRTDPDLAEKFGWKGTGGWGDPEFEKWAGAKAHQLWLEDAKEALSKPETLEQLKKLGYSADAEGYAQMMHRIGKGFVEIDPETGKINLVDTEYLKARVPPEVVVPPEKVVPEKPLSPEEIALAEERISKPIAEMPGAKPTEQIFAEVSPEVGRAIITEKLHETFGMWSGTYDKFSDKTLEEFLKFDNSAYYRNISPPWEDYNYHEISDFQGKIEKFYNTLSSSEKLAVDKESVEGFIKKYFVKIFTK